MAKYLIKYGSCNEYDCLETLRGVFYFWLLCDLLYLRSLGPVCLFRVSSFQEQTSNTKCTQWWKNGQLYNRGFYQTSFYNIILQKSLKKINNNDSYSHMFELKIWIKLHYNNQNQISMRQWPYQRALLLAKDKRINRTFVKSAMLWP